MLVWSPPLPSLFLGKGMCVCVCVCVLGEGLVVSVVLEYEHVEQKKEKMGHKMARRKIVNCEMHLSCAVVDYNGSISSTIINRGQRTIFFLSSGVPNSELHIGTVKDQIFGWK